MRVFPKYDTEGSDYLGKIFNQWRVWEFFRDEKMKNYAKEKNLGALGWLQLSFCLQLGS